MEWQKHGRALNRRLPRRQKGRREQRWRQRTTLPMKKTSAADCAGSVAITVSGCQRSGFEAGKCIEPRPVGIDTDCIGCTVDVKWLAEPDELAKWDRRPSLVADSSAGPYEVEI